MAAPPLPPDMVFPYHSDCGHPGDTGNSLGVGQFCIHESDCENNTKANLCTQLGDPDNFFCTFPCSAKGPADQCGENAYCACDSQGRGCGCYPSRCDTGPSPDMSVSSSDMSVSSGDLGP